MTPEEFQNLLRISDVAERLNVHTATVRRMIQRGELPAVKIGKNVRVQPADLDAYIQAAHIKTPDPATN